MKPSRAVLSALIIGRGFAQSGDSQVPKVSLIPHNSVIRSVLVDRIDKYRQSVGIVVGVIEPKGRRIVAYGARDQGNPAVLDGDTVFEIGSITKVFTTLLLAEMVRRGEVALDDPVAKYLPAKVSVPERGGRRITLQDLATHTSGLPHDPSNIRPQDPANPAADYSVEQLYAFLSSYTLTRDIGVHYEYSNAGVALLGHALANRSGMDYEALVEARILKPLGMTSTRFSLSQEMKNRLAPGHSYMLERLPNWDMEALAPSGGLKSTANDLLTLLDVALGYRDTPLAGAIANTMGVRRPAGHPDRQSGLGWEILTLMPGYEFISHGGATGGYRTFLGMDRGTRSGVVVLSNAATPSNIVDIGMHLLNPEIPLESAKLLIPPKRRAAVTVDARLFAGYVGRYSLPRGNVLTITLDGDQLFEQRNGDLKVPIYPESKVDYFCRLFDEQVSFTIDAQGLATGLTFTHNGVARPAKRMK